eukprot:320804-Chlamydomonas_euryale.AAC.1
MHRMGPHRRHPGCQARPGTKRLSRSSGSGPSSPWQGSARCRSGRPWPGTAGDKSPRACTCSPAATQV